MWDHQPDPDLPYDRAQVNDFAKSILRTLKVSDPSSAEVRQMSYTLVLLARRAWDAGRTFQATATPEQRGLRP